jgi:ribosomal protein S27AE
MVGVLALAILLVAAADRFYGHSTLAFAAAIVMLLVANAPMLRFNCPKCGKNAFFRGPLVVFWPNRICQRCGHDLDSPAPSQNR